MQFASGYFAMTVESGSKTQVYAAVSQEVDELDLKWVALLSYTYYPTNHY